MFEIWHFGEVTPVPNKLLLFVQERKVESSGYPDYCVCQPSHLHRASNIELRGKTRGEGELDEIG